jgi:hypothetical protein
MNFNLVLKEHDTKYIPQTGLSKAKQLGNNFFTLKYWRMGKIFYKSCL